MCYMSHLFAVLKKENLHESILFVDPTKTYAGGSWGTDNDRSDDLMRRFQMGREEFIFCVPYNPGKHWTLSVVDVRAKVVYWFDPAARRITAKPDWIGVVNNVVKSYHLVKEPEIKSKVKVQWKYLHGSPRQRDNKSCGYYILRYMRDIVYGKGLQTFDKWAKRNYDAVYEAAEIDEVRKEWAEQVISLLDSQM
ncbi:hypothetical protein M5689_018989 [Euphorbia peplus]|nr:hypothetical protein M5689_018989 [Euphorbia peplus]